MTKNAQGSLERYLEKAKALLLKELKLEASDFDFHLVSNREMEKIRRTILARPDFKGHEARKIRKEKQVNVLAFPAGDDFPQPRSAKKLLGEIFLNKDYSGDSARWSTLGPLFIHGFLHLLGYRHYFERDRIKMQKLEKRLWHLTLLSDSTSAPPRSRRVS